MCVLSLGDTGSCVLRVIVEFAGNFLANVRHPKHFERPIETYLSNDLSEIVHVVCITEAPLVHMGFDTTHVLQQLVLLLHLTYRWDPVNFVDSEQPEK